MLPQWLKSVANIDNVGSLSIRPLCMQFVFSHVTCVFYSMIYIVLHDGMLNCGASCTEQCMYRYAEPCACAQNSYRYRLGCISRVDSRQQSGSDIALFVAGVLILLRQGS